MREHRYSVEFPHSPERLWALMQDYDRWTEYAPMVVRVDVLHPGDKEGNGLLRRVIYQMPLGRSGSLAAGANIALECSPRRWRPPPGRRR